MDTPQDTVADHANEPLLTMEVPPKAPEAAVPTLPAEDEAAPSKPRTIIHPHAPASITLSDGSDKPPLTFECQRNILTMGALIAKNAKEFADPAKVHVKIVTQAINIDTKETNPITICRGLVGEVCQQLGSQFIPAQRATQLLSQIMTDLCEFSAMKTLMVIGVFGDGGKDGQPGVGGFSAFNGRLDISAADAIIHASAVQGELDRFKDSMRKQGVQFPDDSKIVVPGSDGFRVPRAMPPGGGGIVR